MLLLQTSVQLKRRGRWTDLVCQIWMERYFTLKRFWADQLKLWHGEKLSRHVKLAAYKWNIDILTITIHWSWINLLLSLNKNHLPRACVGEDWGKTSEDVVPGLYCSQWCHRTVASVEGARTGWRSSLRLARARKTRNLFSANKISLTDSAQNWLLFAPVGRENWNDPAVHRYHSRTRILQLRAKSAPRWSSPAAWVRHTDHWPGRSPESDCDLNIASGNVYL